MYRENVKYNAQYALHELKHLLSSYNKIHTFCSFYSPFYICCIIQNGKLTAELFVFQWINI